MNIVLLGLNHKTAPIELRERLAVAPQELEQATRSLVESPGVLEGMILSTCNRVEVLASLEADAPHLMTFLGDYFSVDAAELAPHIYEYRQENAVRHLFRVACSLDSMVIGEPQILGQVKSSYLAARSAGAVRGHLDKVLQRAFVVAKRVRTETQIGNSSVSIASVAVELARKIFGSLQDKKVLLVGAGKMSEQAARHLVNQGASHVLVANRTHERAAQMADRFGGRALHFNDLYAHADQADIVITSTGAPRPIFRREHAQHFLQQRRGRPMFFIDIAVPRDVDPEINRLDGIFLYDIDDLQSVAGSHMKERSKEAELAEAMILAEVDKYQQRLHSLNVGPEISRFHQAAEQIRLGELRRIAGRLQGLSSEQQAAVEALTRGLVNKFLHRPVQAIKAAARHGNAAGIEALRDAFGADLSALDLNEDDEFDDFEPDTQGKAH
ncbi:MAG TPA: glutamyl-tRNA reductase [Acidobacteriaceae bacterium]|nr:glutamyl-tRNA reductase [Acidobacteriaceae bacterium]